MTDAPDDRLLEQYSRHGSDEAFAALVRRHIALVHSVALRHTASAQHAEDITQAVFVILARKAGALGRKTVLPGWLYHTARLTAANLQRAEARRIHREQEAFMQSQSEEITGDALWHELSPQLDEAMAGLGAGERDALVLRYFQNQSMSDVGKQLGLEENTAQKRVSRALEKLRVFFAKRGVVLTAAVIAGTLTTHSVQAAPAALTQSVTAVALVKGATASTSTLTLIKGALKIMALTKVKTVVVAGACVLLAAGTTTVVAKKMSGPKITGAMWELSLRNLTNLPPVLVLRESKFAPADAGGWSDADGRIIERHVDFDSVIGCAYGYFPAARVHFSSVPPNGKFDFILTLQDHPKEAMANAIKKQFGWVAHKESLPTDILLLQSSKTGVHNLQRGRGQRPEYSFDDTSFTLTNGGMVNLESVLESLLNTPVVDRTGLAGTYDITLTWKPSATDDQKKSAIKQALLEQLGLELVPTNMPIEMLVVEKAK
jgi:RNA polymerase sigma factor (sigma-70 family)